MYTSSDPEPVAQRIMAMFVRDGIVLIENIYFINHPAEFAGTEWISYLDKLRRISSIVPDDYLRRSGALNTQLTRGRKC
jgi:hypothetical protein